MAAVPEAKVPPADSALKPSIHLLHRCPGVGTNPRDRLACWRLTLIAVGLPRDQVSLERSGDPRPNIDEHVADWFEDHSVAGDEIHAMCWSAGLCGNITADPPYRYLWKESVLDVPGSTLIMVDLRRTRPPQVRSAISGSQTVRPHRWRRSSHGHPLPTRRHGRRRSHVRTERPALTHLGPWALVWSRLRADG